MICYLTRDEMKAYWNRNPLWLQTITKDHVYLAYLIQTGAVVALWDIQSVLQQSMGLMCLLEETSTANIFGIILLIGSTTTVFTTSKCFCKSIFKLKYCFWRCCSQAKTIHYYAFISVFKLRILPQEDYIIVWYSYPNEWAASSTSYWIGKPRRMSHRKLKCIKSWDGWGVGNWWDNR